MTLVGRHIGRYRILEQLGQGGMSVVYKGLDTTLDREVAVKVLHPHLSGRAESRKRLEREAKAVARLHHPNILEVFDFSAESSSDAFLVTEYIRGKTLRDFINDEPLQPPEIAAMVVHELAAALAHAHEAGILHRDLKPENVMVREDGVLKLMDFGIAKILDRDEKMTMTGALVGSPAHMAPEIIEGEEAGAEADVFSLGTMLYLFATGRLPFVAPNTTATLKKILDSTYDDPRQVVPTVSDELAEIIATCLQRQPNARYPTATRLRDALAELLVSVGLTRPHEELAAFFLDPRGYRQALTPRLTEALLSRAQRFIDEKKPAKAMGALNQVLAHEPSNQRATALLGQMRSRKQRAQRAKRLRAGLIALCGGAVVVTAGAFGVRAALRPAPYEVPLPPIPPSQLVLANVTWPAPKPPPPAAVEPAPEVHDTPAPVAEPERRSAPRPLRSDAIDIAAMVRPFGYLQVDDGPRSAEPLARHQLKLPPGKHRFVVTCEQCEASGKATTVEIKPGGQDVALVAPLKPSLVTFRGWPERAVVRVGATEMTVAQSQQTPFRAVTPVAGSPEMRHRVDYEITLDGARLARGVAFAAPGTPLLVEPGGQ